MTTLPPRLSVLALAVVAAWPAAAQQASTAATAEEDSAQRIVVTANKRQERQRDLAGTVSVLDGGDLERRGARNQEDMLKLTPGVQFNKGNIASNTISIRGIATFTANEGGGAQQAPTGNYLEDVPLAAFSGKGTVVDPALWDIDRVEVLRGPQGVLFGSGSLGGAVRYLLNKPDLKTFGASVMGSYDKVSAGAGAFSLFGMVNAPLSANTAGLRVVAFDRTDPGYVDNLGTGTKDANETRTRGGRVLLTLKPTKDTTATLVASTQKSDQDDTSSVSPDRTKLQHTAPTNGSISSTSDFYSLTLDANLGRATLTSITGHWRNKGSTLGDDTELFAAVGLALPKVTRPSTSESKATSQELRIASNPGGSFSYVAGLFWQKGDAVGSGKQIDPSKAFGIETLVDLTSTSTGSEKAAFVDTEWALGSGWSVGAGGRYYKTRTTFRQTGTTFGAPSPVPDPSSGRTQNVGNDSGVTPKLTVKYRFGENQWYALASKGYRYGGTNSDNSEYKSDSLWSYETGLRLSPAAGVQLDLAAFLLDWKDLQYTFFTIRNNLPSSGIGNVAAAKSKGLEAALRMRVNSSFDWSASLAYIDASTDTVTRVPAGRGSVEAPAGSRLPGSAKLQGALQGNLRFAGPMGSAGRLNATYTHVGNREMFLGNTKPAGAYDTLDLMLNLAFSNVTVSAGLSNVTDERGVQSITGSPGGAGPFAQYFLQRPRTFTVSLRYDM